MEPKANILAVDDEPRSTELMVRALRGLGHVETASGGEEAWQKFCAGDYDLVVTDQRMPDVTGAELLARVSRRSEHTGRVLLTGYADMEATVAAINEGRLHAYVTKPWRPDHLVLTARTLIERGRLARKNEVLVTELSARNAQLEMALSDLRKAQHDLVAAESLSAVGRMVAMVVHDLRGPLSVIRSASAMLVGTEFNLPESERAELLRQIDHETDRLAAMCSELLELSRASAGEAEQEEADLDEVVCEVLKSIAEPAGHAGVRVIERLDCHARALLDPHRVHRALLNLATNAVQAMPDGGTLRIESHREGSFALVRVADTGGGVPEELQKTLFDPFVSQRPGGTGLGLAIARRVIEEHGGEIEMVKTGAQGTTFDVRLPLES